MKIQNIPWITHTHTDCYDVCKIYEGEMPYLLWGNDFWNNHIYLVNSEQNSEKLKYKLTGKCFYYDDEINYPHRILNILTNIDSEYIVLDHEDMFLYQKANIDQINKSIELIINKELDSIRFIKNINAKYTSISKNCSVEKISSNSEWIFSIQPSVWRKKALIEILKKNLNVNIWELENKSQKVVRELGIKIGVLSGESKKRGIHHCDSEYYPYIATALFKGKWTLSEYEKELKSIFNKYQIDPLIRGSI
tara:strand:- start:96 stop:845 length:750 start_codon:yes stop_codon:yes gene_type:complete